MYWIVPVFGLFHKKLPGFISSPTTFFYVIMTAFKIFDIKITLIFSYKIISDLHSLGEVIVHIVGKHLPKYEENKTSVNKVKKF